MKHEPSERLDPRARTLWRVSNALGGLPLLAMGGGASWFLWRVVETPLFVWVLPTVVMLLIVLFNVFVVPGLQWRRWRYEIRADEIDLQRGIFWVRRTLVPLARIQHVDTRHGPLQRRFGLATVVFYTAAGPNSIPELAAPVAGDVRDRISALTGEQDEL